MVMHELADDDPEVLAGNDLAGPNQWPTFVPELKPAVSAYVAAMTALCRKLTSLIELSLNAQPGSLMQHFSKPTTFLRLLHYPPQQHNTACNVYGSAPHTDYGFITLLAQDLQCGLQVRSTRGEWLDVKPQPGTFVMNVGDMLQRYSNGRFISTPHRVISRATTSRYSVPFFYDPHIQSIVQPLDVCVQNTEQPMYEPIAYGDYLMERLRSNHQQHRER